MDKLTCLHNNSQYAVVLWCRRNENLCSESGSSVEAGDRRSQIKSDNYNNINANSDISIILFLEVMMVFDVEQTSGNDRKLKSICFGMLGEPHRWQ